MKVDDQVLVHVEELSQHLVREFRREDLQITDCTKRLTHLEGPPVFEDKTGRGDEVLCRKPGLNELFILEGKRCVLLRIKGFIEDLQAFYAV